MLVFLWPAELIMLLGTAAISGLAIETTDAVHILNSIKLLPVKQISDRK